MIDRLERAVRETPDLPAISNETDAADFGQLQAMVQALRPLVAPRNHPAAVLLAVAGGPVFTAVQLACLAEQAIVAPISHQSKPHEIEGYLALLQPDCVFVPEDHPIYAWPGFEAVPVDLPALSGHDAFRLLVPSGRAVDAVHPARDLPGGTVMVQFTSGSTGQPKGIALSAGNIESYLDSAAEFLEGFRGRQVFCPMPQFHAFGNTVVLEHILSGCGVHVTNTFMPGEDVRRMTEHRCVSLLAAPTYLRLLDRMQVLSQEYLPDLASVSLGTAAIDQALVEMTRAGLPDLVFHLRYGLTETMGPLTRLILEPGHDLGATGAVGSPLAGVQLHPETAEREADATEIRVRSGVVAVGRVTGVDRWETLNDDEDWFPTGDLGFRDANGDIHLRGRLSTFIKRNGFRINPFEIEDLIRQLPGVREAVVLGLPDPEAGQKIVLVVDAAGPQMPETKDILKHCRENLSVHKLPQVVRIEAGIPRTGSGKPDRKAIAAEL